jgi:hypothetical protein
MNEIVFVKGRASFRVADEDRRILHVAHARRCPLAAAKPPRIAQGFVHDRRLRTVDMPELQDKRLGTNRSEATTSL